MKIEIKDTVVEVTVNDSIVYRGNKDCIVRFHQGCILSLKSVDSSTINYFVNAMNARTLIAITTGSEIPFYQNVANQQDSTKLPKGVNAGTVGTGNYFGPISEKHEESMCFHDLKEYVGLRESYKYCTKCNHTDKT